MAEELQKFVGKWKMDRAENLEEFMKAMGMNFFIRKMASRAYPEQVVSIEGGTMHVSIQTAFMTREDNIKINQEYEKYEEKMGIKFRCKTRVEDGKLIINQEVIEGGNGQKPQEITREIINGEKVITVKIGDLVSTRWFKKIE